MISGLGNIMVNAGALVRKERSVAASTGAFFGRHYAAEKSPVRWSNVLVQPLRRFCRNRL
jgi:hypothetical protein